MTRPNFRITRDTVSYSLGVVGTVYETVLADGPAGERLPFLVIFVGLITAPAFLRKDDRAKEAVKEAAKEPAKEPAPPPAPGG